MRHDLMILVDDDGSELHVTVEAPTRQCAWDRLGDDLTALCAGTVETGQHTPDERADRMREDARRAANKDGNWLARVMAACGAKPGETPWEAVERAIVERDETVTRAEKAELAMNAAETRCRAACPPRDGESWVDAVERVGKDLAEHRVELASVRGQLGSFVNRVAAAEQERDDAVKRAESMESGHVLVRSRIDTMFEAYGLPRDGNLETTLARLTREKNEAREAGQRMADALQALKATADKALERRS
jgi:hypothetical protein